MVFITKDIIVPEKKFSGKEFFINIDFQGKTALVCGSSKGIGRATAIGLAKLNANVILLSRSEEILRDLCKSLPGSGRHSYLAVDVSDFQKLKEKIENYLVDYGSIQILINNTGGPKGGLISSATEDEFIEAFRNHLLVNSLLTGLVLPGMKELGYGRIINILSTSVKIPIPNLGVSNTVRAAVANWAKTLAGEVAGFGITVNNVLPGYTDTERLSFLMQSAADRQNKPLSEIKKAWIDTIPAGRLGLPEEIANAVVFLSSPAASYINGVNLPVDGGRTGSL